jgi:hypothetical protein
MRALRDGGLPTIRLSLSLSLSPSRAPARAYFLIPFLILDVRP